MAHILKNPNKRIYVSDLAISENLIIQYCLNAKETRTMTHMIIKKRPHHIVGVPLLCWCIWVKIGDHSPVTEASRICCPALWAFRNLIYKG